MGTERADKLTMDSTVKRASSTVVKENSELWEQEEADAAKLNFTPATTRTPPKMAVHVHSPMPSVDPYSGKIVGGAEQSNWNFCRASMGRVCCFLCGPSVSGQGTALSTRERNRYLKTAADDMEGVSILKLEHQYQQN